LLIWTSLIHWSFTLFEVRTPFSGTHPNFAKALRLTSSTDGSLRRRCLKQDNTPETVPFLPHEFATRQSDLGLLDYSAMPIEGAELSDFDPLERARLRQLIERYGGDATLLDLDDGALDGALGFTARSATQAATSPEPAGAGPFYSEK